MKKYNSTLSEATIEASFDPPLICIGNAKNGFSIRMGPKSSVYLDTPYVDDKIRLGVGARGSEFIFTRTTDPRAQECNVWLKKVAFPARPLGIATIVFGLLINRLFVRISNATDFVLKVPGVMFAVLGLLFLTSGGGIDEADNHIEQ